MLWRRVFEDDVADTTHLNYLFTYLCKWMCLYFLQYSFNILSIHEAFKEKKPNMSVRYFRNAAMILGPLGCKFLSMPFGRHNLIHFGVEVSEQMQVYPLIKAFLCTG